MTQRLQPKRCVFWLTLFACVAVWHGLPVELPPLGRNGGSAQGLTYPPWLNRPLGHRASALFEEIFTRINVELHVAGAWLNTVAHGQGRLKLPIPLG